MYFQYLLASAFITSFAIAQSTNTTAYTGTLTPKVYPRLPGWSNDRSMFVYLFDNKLTGTAGKVDSAPIWVFRRDTDIMSTPLQNNLIDVAPGETGYSDLWSVNIVTVSANTTTGNITSKSMLDALIASKAVTVTSTPLLVNCPVVHPQSTLAVPADGKFVTGWYKGQPINYFDFGPNGVNGTAPGNNYVQPVWVPVLANGTGIGNHVFPGVSTDPGYTEFWAVTTVPVPAGYVADQYRKAADWGAAGIQPSPVSPLTIVNCPVVGPVAPPTPFSLMGNVGASPSAAASKSAGVVMHLSGAVALALVAMIL
ncbi:hypothetical protein BC830DRAFT_1125425 [Chytriomyces sp. MP71]|nr:hypothetical protein BC830DRAFT_1125425 [Chytriomyces sp. MP71]